MNLSTRQQWLGLIAIAGLALLAADSLVRAPLVRLWKERSAEIARAKASVERGESLLSRERVIRDRWSHMRTNTLSSEVSVAENQVFRAFERWSQGNRMVINGIKPQWRNYSEDYATLECRVDAAGALGDLTRFLYEIERDPLGLRLEVVELNSRDDRGQQLTLGLQVSGLQLNATSTP
jgi:hypothetical protein